GAIFGDTLARVARHLGYKFDTEYYVNDAGNQIDLLGLSVLSKVKILCLNEELEYPENAYKGEYIDDLAREAFANFEKDFFTMDNVSNLAFWAKDKMLDLIKQNLAQANIIIDHYVSERSYYNALEDTIRSLKAHGGVYEKDYKIWPASSLK
ncbi:hypothetical protein, partial [Klebsiella pneumoniae]|uniref:hypothetical protein n=1 Tax=Klebsiella pneumoniae TaxID=573 RepID=UPI001969A321